MKKRNITQLKLEAQLFSSCKNLNDLQRKFKIAKNEIIMNALNPKYYQFKIRKHNGSYREIEAPDLALKQLQTKLNYFLQAVYYLNQTKASYGYIITPRNKKSTKNIVKNATQHLGCSYMLKADFKDFFHQIKQKDIFTIFNSNLFSFDKKTSNYLSKISTYNNRLPMGSPLSPVLSNFHTISLDNKLLKWANQNKLTYSRFVDDLTFSSKTKKITQKHFSQINNICVVNHLTLNKQKTHFYNKEDIKTVTGLLLSDTIDIQPDFYKALDKNLQRLKAIIEANILINNFQKNEVLNKFKQKIFGQINFIRTVEGHKSPIYKEYLEKYILSKQIDMDKLSENWMNFSYI